MWRYIISDDDLLHLVATHWILPIATGYLPPKYRDHLAGGRLVALSKRPKTGIRPVNVTDAWRQLKDYSQLKDYCRIVCANTNSFFTKPSKSVPICHCNTSIIKDVVATNSLDNDPIVVGTFDIKNSFNILQRQHINNQITCSS